MKYKIKFTITKKGIDDRMNTWKEIEKKLTPKQIVGQMNLFMPTTELAETQYAAGACHKMIAFTQKMQNTTKIRRVKIWFNKFRQI